VAVQLAEEGESGRRRSRSDTMSAGLARNWRAVGMRAGLAVLFAITVLLLPRPTLGVLVLTFAAYVAADGAMAIVAGIRAMRRGELWQTLIFEGAVNISVAGVVLAWPAMAAVAFVRLTSVWAILTGALLLAAARRLSLSHGRWLLALAGVVSGVWGVLAAAVGPSSESTPETIAWWLVGYALPFAVMLLALAGLLQRRHQQSIRAIA
jgi:uncharacterized membrane protein HdeD (DUF308 family)